MIEKLVSVIIPIYNVKEYLDECIESVVKQTYKNLEILLVDDGSTDGTAQKCDIWATYDNRIEVFHKKNGGLSSARNYGFKASKGDYIYFLDSDDYIDLSTIKLLIEFAENNHLDMVLFNGQCFWDQQQTENFKKQYYNIYKKSLNKVQSGPQIYLQLKKNKEYYPAVPMHFYKRELLIRNRLEFMDGILHEDELFSVMAYYYANLVGCCCKTLYWRRMRNSSIMNTTINKKNVESCYQIINAIISKIKDEKDEDSKEKKRMIRLGLAHCLWLYYVRFDQLSLQERNQIDNEKRKLDQILKNENYFDSVDVLLCNLKRLLIPLRNNNTIYDFYKKYFL